MITGAALRNRPRPGYRLIMLGIIVLCIVWAFLPTVATMTFFADAAADRGSPSPLLEWAIASLVGPDEDMRSLMGKAVFAIGFTLPEMILLVTTAKRLRQP